MSVVPFAPIAIVGYACLLPGAHTPDALWELAVRREVALTHAARARWRLDPGTLLIDRSQALAGVEGVVTDRGGFVTGFDAAFDPEGFALDPALVASLDAVTRWLLHVGRAALGDAGRPERPTAYRRGGAIVGNLGYLSAGLYDVADAVRAGRPIAQPLLRFNTGLPVQHLAALALADGGFALDAACASSLYALKFACDRLADGAADFMLAGGINAIDNVGLFAGFSALGALSPSGRSRPFDRDADGLLPAEGAALFVLKRLADAERDGDTIRGVIRGIGLGNGGRGSGNLVPSVAGQVAAMRAAYASAGLEPSAISYIEAHATGTALGDAVEIASTGAVFAGLREVPIGSLKANLGHAMTASGAAGLVRVLEALRRRVRPPMPPVDAPLPALAESPFRIIAAPEPWDAAGPRRAAVSSFGFGGNDAHLIVEEWTEPRRARLPAAVPRAAAPPIAIVAIAARVADGSDAGAFREHLYAGRRRGDDTGARALPLAIAPRAFRIPRDDFAAILPQHVFALAVASEAAAATSLPAARTSVFIGMQCDAEGTRGVFRLRHEDLGSERSARESGMPHVGPVAVLGTMPNMPTNRVNAHLDLRGPSCSIFAEELSGLEALRIAVRALAHGEIDAAIVGAVDLCVEPTQAAAVRALYPPAFHRPGDAAIAFVLKREADALHDGDAIVARVAADDGTDAESWDAVAERTRATFGYAHAASALVDVAAAALAVRDRLVPPSTAHDGTETTPVAGDGERRVRVRARGLTGAEAAVGIVSSPAAVAQPWSPDDDSAELVAYAAETRDALIAAVTADARTVPTAEAPAPFRLAIVARPGERAERRRAALAFLRAPTNPPPRNVFFGAGAAPGELALVFTGSGAGYAGAARELILAFPDVRLALAARFPGIEEYLRFAADDAPRGDESDRLGWTSYVSQFHALLVRDVLGVTATAAIGLSSGETNALFALGAWDDMAGLFADARANELYEGAISGRYDVVRAHFAAVGIAGVRWANWHAAADRAVVEAAIAAEPGTYLSIVYAPASVMFGGEEAACARVAARLPQGCAARVDVDLACHVEAIAAYGPTWRRLHHRPTTAPRDVRFYANAHNGAYALTRDRVADALAAQAIAPIDFPRTIARAYDDGVRTYLELGPRDQCSRATAATLGARPHLAVALDAYGSSPLYRVRLAAAALFARGVPIDLRRLIDEPASPRTAPEGIRIEPHPPAPVPRADHDALPRAPELSAPSPAHAMARDAVLPAGDAGLRLSRAALETYASARISDVFGPFFARQDGYERQVRMPAPPFLFADRITGISGIPGNGDLGTLVSETDVLADAWYLDDGHVPLSVTAEAGQADLLLISWLGADFRNKGERVYRLLGCDLTLFGGLPVAGDTLRYAIAIDGEATIGDLRVFFFHFDCTIDGVVRLRVRNGQAGFFTADELAQSGGVIWAPTDPGAGPDPGSPNAAPIVLPRARRFDAAAFRAFADGDVYGAFGAGFERAASHTRTPRMPTAVKPLIREVTDFDPTGGPYGRGYIRAETAVPHDDWFFAAHFKNDPCMPGSLMLDAAVQLLAFFQTASGRTLDRDGWRFEPAAGERFHLNCRGQVGPDARAIVYEVFVRESTADDEPILRADFLATVDGLKSFSATNIALRLRPDWPLPPRPATLAPSLIDAYAVRAWANGRPDDFVTSEALATFPKTRNIQRLPSPPFLFVTRLRELVESDVPDRVGTFVVAEFDLRPDDWFFARNGGTMPFFVLLEAALQPCGCVATRIGATLPRDEVLQLRHLDGDAVVHASVVARTGTLVTRATLSGYTMLGDVRLTRFALECRLDDVVIFTGTTTFGIFPTDMLREQTGLPWTDAERAALAEPANGAIDLRIGPDALPGRAPMLAGDLLMVDRVTGWWPAGGVAGRGRIRGAFAVDPRSWMFKAHFFNDPVQPGSLGLEALLQLVQAAMRLLGLDAGFARPRFSPIANGAPLTWRYRGQVTPSNHEVTTLVDIVDIVRENGAVTAYGEGMLVIDGMKIYAFTRFGVRIEEAR